MLLFSLQIRVQSNTLQAWLQTNMRHTTELRNLKVMKTNKQYAREKDIDIDVVEILSSQTAALFVVPKRMIVFPFYSLCPLMTPQDRWSLGSLGLPWDPLGSPGEPKGSQTSRAFGVWGTHDQLPRLLCQDVRPSAEMDVLVLWEVLVVPKSCGPQPPILTEHLESRALHPQTHVAWGSWHSWDAHRAWMQCCRQHLGIRPCPPVAVMRVTRHCSRWGSVAASNWGPQLRQR